MEFVELDKATSVEKVQLETRNYEKLFEFLETEIAKFQDIFVARPRIRLFFSKK